MLGCLVRGHEKNRAHVSSLLPGKNFSTVIEVLQEFILFQSNVSVLTKETLNSLNEVIDTLCKYDKESKAISSTSDSK